MKTKEKIYRGSENIFADIGLPHPERVKARADIMLAITDIIKKRGLTQEEAGTILGIPQSKVSGLMNGKLSLFSIDNLLQFLNALHTSVNIVLNQGEGQPAITQVIREEVCVVTPANRHGTWERLHLTLKAPVLNHRIRFTGGNRISQYFSTKKYNSVRLVTHRAREKASFAFISGAIQ